MRQRVRQFAHELSLRPKAAGNSRLLDESAGNLVDLRDVLRYGAAAPPALFKAGKMVARLERAIEKVQEKPLRARARAAVLAATKPKPPRCPGPRRKPTRCWFRNILDVDAG